MKLKVYVNLHWNKYSKEFEYRLSNYPADANDDYVTVHEKEVEFETVEDARTKRLIHDALLHKRSKLLADAHVEANELMEMAQELLAIEFKAVVVAGEADDSPF